MVTQLYAVIDKPRQPLLSNYDHWSILLIHLQLQPQQRGQTQAQADTAHAPTPIYATIEVEGSPGTYTYVRRHSTTDPRHTERFSAALHMGDIADANVGELMALLEQKCGGIVDNETTGWDCQDFVLETLDLVFEEGLLDCAEYDEGDVDVRRWNRQMRKLRVLRGENDDEED